MNIFIAGLSYQISETDLRELLRNTEKYPQPESLPTEILVVPKATALLK